MSHRVTLKDVANHAGVSVTTVSNVVRDWPYVAEETRVKVQSSISELGYSPHPIAQGLRTGQTQVIGFIVPDLSNPYFASMVSVAEDVAQEHGYSLLVFNSHEDDARQSESIQRATKRWVDGLLIAHIASLHPNANIFHNVTIPTVLIDRTLDGYVGPSCTLDNFRAAELATNHLCDLGHKRIAHLAGHRGALPARERLNGYLRAIQTHHLEYRRIIDVANGAWGCDEGYQAMRQLLQDDVLPTAVFASNDRMAIGASSAIHEARLRVPEDISLVGVDDIEVSQYLNPGLTTVRQPLERMARVGIDLLLRLIRLENPSDIHLVLEPQLVMRQSTASPK
jgi:DNA-binding LacI/PurR family transcriptional regulator